MNTWEQEITKTLKIINEGIRSAAGYDPSACLQLAHAFPVLAATLPNLQHLKPEPADSDDR